jgi:hypothetical protein
MDEISGILVREEKCKQALAGSLKKGENLEDVDVTRKIILKWVINRQPISKAERSKARLCDRSLAKIEGLNSARQTHVCLF